MELERGEKKGLFGGDPSVIKVRGQRFRENLRCPAGTQFQTRGREGS